MIIDGKETGNELFVPDTTHNYARSISLRIDQQIRVCLRPRPKYVSEKLWLRIAALFIRIEKTQPSFSVEEQK